MIMWFLFACGSHYELQAFHYSAVFRTRCFDVDPRRVDRGMAEHVRQFGNVMLSFVESPGKQFAQVVREHLLRGYFCCRRQRLHRCPDIGHHADA